MLTRLLVRLLLICSLLTFVCHNDLNAQTTIYWKMDHIRDASGVEIAIATPRPSDTTAPSAPSGLNHSSLGDSSVALSWTGSTDNSGGSGLAGYRIYRFNLPIAIVGNSTTTFTDTTLQPGTIYDYKVAAFDVADNQSSFSNIDTFTTTGVPAAPRNLHASRASSGLAIDLWWTDQSLSETVFKIERKAWSGGSYSQIDTVAANTNSYTDTSVVGGTIYYYRVRAYNGGGNSDYSNEASACTCSSSSTALAATASSSSQVDLVWSALSGSIDHYSVERRSSVNDGFTEIGTTTGTSYSDTSVSSGTTYMYKVYAINSSSNPIGATDADIATTVIFTNDPLVARTTVILAQHITELRTTVDAARAAADLSSASWTDSSLSGVAIKAVHISELRTQLNAALAAMGFSVPTYTDSTLATGTTTVKKVHLLELREALK